MKAYESAERGSYTLDHYSPETKSSRDERRRAQSPDDSRESASPSNRRRKRHSRQSEHRHPRRSLVPGRDCEAFRSRSRDRSPSRHYRRRQKHHKDGSTVSEHIISRSRHDRDGQASQDSNEAHCHRHRRKHHVPRGESPSYGSEADEARTRPTQQYSPIPPVTFDSDPLEDLIGPLPPRAQSPVRLRGRGAFAASSGIDSRFSASYDPAADVQLNEGGLDDDWDQALEALRDRQRWKSHGSDRLRAAGFTDEEVSKWERGDGSKENDVVWKKTGERREWDRGKVVDGDGHIMSQHPEQGSTRVTHHSIS